MIGKMSFKQILIIIAVIQLFSVISITGFYYLMSPLQNCIRIVDDGKRMTTKTSAGNYTFCFKNNSW
jgi:Na+-transporting NADH:ubiquinone oxidoreductase subunit NqrC